MMIAQERDVRRPAAPDGEEKRPVIERASAIKPHEPSLLPPRRMLPPRLRFDLQVLALYAVLALALLAPFASNLIPLSTGGGDIVAHMTGVREARDALAEGQFPLRVAPNVQDGMRYPYFAFYGNLPFLLPGAATLLLHIHPYAALKLMLGLALCGGAYFLYRAALLLRRGAGPAVLAGVIFMSAPYLLADIFARFAYPETISFCLLPVVLYTALRVYLVHRAPALPILGNGFAWAALALSHNITFLYGSAFFALFFLSFARWNRRYLWRMARLGMGYGIGLALTLWYLVPQLTVVAKLAIAATNVELLQRGLTPFGTLLSPTLISPYGLPTPNLGLQVGVPITVSVGFMVYLIAARQMPRRIVPFVIRLLLFFVIALVMAWDPKPTPLEFWWRVLPRIFLNVQFPYRLLMFVVLWGSLLAAYALAALCRDGMRRGQFVLALVALLIGAAPFLPAIPRPYAADFAPDLGKGETTQYLLTDAATSPYALAGVDDPAVVRLGDIMNSVRHGVRSDASVTLSGARIVQVPALFYPRLLRVRVDNRPVAYGAVGRYAAVALPAGEHRITVEFAGIRWANIASGIAWVAALLALCALLVARGLHLLRWVPPRPPVRRAIIAAVAIGATVLLLLPTLLIPYERRSAINAAVALSPAADAPASFSLDVTFVRPTADAKEPLLTSGKANAGDFVYVRYLPGDMAVIASDHWGGKTNESDPIALTPGRVYRIDIVLDRLNSLLVVTVDGHRTLRVATPVYPAKRGEITVGENRIGGNVTAARFSGTVSVVRFGMIAT